MPSEHKSLLADQHQQDQLQGQAKECPICHATLQEPATSLFLSESSTVVCLGCRERTLALISTQDVRQHRIDHDALYPVRQLTHELPIPQSTRRYQDILPADFDSVVSSSPASSVLESSISYPSSSPPSPSYSNKSLNIQCNSIPQPTLPRHQSSFVSHSYESTRPKSSSYSSPDPLSDITRLRTRSRGHHCLHPGSAFQGTQKSGRNSYDVNVTIVVCLLSRPLRPAI
jgi:glucose-induced degradation protein 4